MSYGDIVWFLAKDLPVSQNADKHENTNKGFNRSMRPGGFWSILAKACFSKHTSARGLRFEPVDEQNLETFLFTREHSHNYHSAVLGDAFFIFSVERMQSRVE